jgi:predicted nucleotidyltransferase
VISTDIVNEIVQRIVERFDPEKIILFGSYARGEAREDSDIDLLIVAETDLPPPERYPAVRRVVGDLPYAFDLFLIPPAQYHRRRTVVNNLEYLADKYGRVMYERSATRVA